MSTIEIASKVAELRELKRLAEDLNTEIEAIQDSIKAHMAANELDEMSGNDWKATHSQLYDQYCSESATRRFTIA